MVSWAIVNTFGLPIGIYLLRNGMSYYRALQRSRYMQQGSIQPVPPIVARALNLLFISAVFALFMTLPYFSPENIFARTNGRLQTPTDVLFSRLAKLRPLGPEDEIMRSKLASKDNRLIYFAHGPDVLLNCAFCSPTTPWTYLVYNLPVILSPHVANLLVLGLSTSPFFAGPLVIRFRGLATLVGCVVSLADFYLAATYDASLNRTSMTLQDITFFWWRMRVIRWLCIAAMDALLGLVMWASATNRMFAEPSGVKERVSRAAAAIEASNFRLGAAGSVRNTVVRDQELRAMQAEYWEREKEVYEEREVVKAVNSVLGRRTDIPQLKGIADQRAEQAVHAFEQPQQEDPG